MLKGWLRTATLSLVFATMLTAFALSNSQTTKISLIFWRGDVSLALIILISILIGVICTGVLAIAEETKLMRQIKHLEDKVKEFESKTTV